MTHRRRNLFRRLLDLILRGRAVHDPNDLVIVCPDCGEHVAFRNKCPKCAGESWVARGLVREVFKGVDFRPRRWRKKKQVSGSGKQEAGSG